MFLSVLAFVTVFYVLMILLFAVAAWRSRYPTDAAYRPTVSIIVAARNEEKNIAGCLDSMAALTYPRELLDIVVVDDRSEDATARIVTDYAHRFPHIRLITARPGTGTLQGKTNAVTQGIEASSGDIILFTDADCAVPPGWVEGTVQYYTDERIGLVAGFTELVSTHPFEEMQTLDWFYLFSVAAATIRIHYPVTAVGNNLSVRRSAYEAVGGYRTIPFSVTEDYALFHAVTSKKPYRARLPLDASTLVRSVACKTVRELHRQRLRWFTGGRDMDPKSIAILSMPYLLNLLILIGIVILPVHQLLIVVGAKMLVDFLLLLPALKHFRRLFYLRSFPHFEIYYFVYVLLYPVLVLFGQRVMWKERKY